MKVHIVVLSSTVIFTAVSYDVFNSHYITLVFVNMCKYVCTEGRKVE